MADSYIQVPPNSTGAKVRTQTRVVGADTVNEHYFHLLNSSGTEANVSTVDTSNVSVTSCALPAGAATEATLVQVRDNVANVVMCNTDDVTITGFTPSLTISSLQPGTAANELGKATDDVAGGLDVGVAVLAVRVDSPTTLTPANGDYAQLRIDSVGRLHANVSNTVTVTGALTDTQLRASAVPVSLASVPSHAVTNAGTFAVQESGAALTSLQLIDDAVSTTGSAITAKGLTACGTDGTNARALKTDTSGELQVDVLTLPNVTIGAAIPAGTNNIGDVDVLSIAAGDNNIGNVDIVTMPNVTLAAGTNTNEVVGDVAHDVAVAGNPVLVAASSETMADSAPANRVSADADASRLSVTDGALFVIPTGPQTWSYHSNGSSALTDATVHASPGAGLSLYVTDIVCSTGAATAMNIFFEEGSTTVLGPYYLEAVAGRGVAIHFGTPKKITAATALTVTTSAAIAQSVDVLGFISTG